MPDSYEPYTPRAAQPYRGAPTAIRNFLHGSPLRAVHLEFRLKELDEMIFGHEFNAGTLKRPSNETYEKIAKKLVKAGFNE